MFPKQLMQSLLSKVLIIHEQWAQDKPPLIHQLRECKTQAQQEMTTLFFVLILLPALARAKKLVPGGKVNITVEPTYEPVVFAVQAINDKFLANKDTTPRQLAEIIRAQSKVVSGQMLYLTLRLLGAPQEDYCEVVVWYRAWITNADRLFIVDGPTCSKIRIRRTLDDGISNPKVLGTSPPQEVVNALNFSVCTVNDARKSRFLSVLGDTSHVTYTQQVDKGVTYHFSHVPFLRSSCKKSAMSCKNASLSTCHLSSKPRSKLCDFTVLFQSGLSPAYTISGLTCKAIHKLQR